MQWAIIAILGVLILLVVVGLLIWLIITISAGRREAAGQAAGIGLLQQQLEALKVAQDNARSTLEKSLQTGQQTINQSMQSSQQVLGRLNTQIGELQGTSKQMLLLGTEVKRLQDILSGPKLRGQMGEWSLENLLRQVLPKDSYELQYTFRDGQKVDALVKMADYSVGVDAKFPLPSFERLLKAESDDEKAKQRKQFQRDIIIHIDKIVAV